MIYRFDHLHLICKNLETMIDFFTDCLGARLVVRKKFGGADGATLDLEGTTINLRIARRDEKMAGDASQTRYGYDHIGLLVDDLQAAMHALEAKGVEFHTPPKDIGDKLVVFFKGPEQITLELLQLK